MKANKIYRFYENQLDIPQHKILYILNTDSDNMIVGAFESITLYGEKLSTEIFNIFFEVVSAKLVGSYDIEYEFSEKEYSMLMSLKKHINGE